MQIRTEQSTVERELTAFDLDGEEPPCLSEIPEEGDLKPHPARCE